MVVVEEEAATISVPRAAALGIVRTAATSVYRFNKISHEKVGTWSKLAAKRRLG